MTHEVGVGADEARPSLRVRRLVGLRVEGGPRGQGPVEREGPEADADCCGWFLGHDHFSSAAVEGADTVRPDRPALLGCAPASPSAPLTRWPSTDNAVRTGREAPWAPCRGRLWR